MALKFARLFTLGNRSVYPLLKTNPTSRINLVKVISSIPPNKYPLARRDESIIDDFHGIKVADPYRWMEDPNLPETKEWIQELNKIAEPFLAAGENRKKINQKLTELWDYEKFGCTEVHGEYYYYTYNSGLQNQSVIYQQKNYKEKGKLFFDPNILSDDGTTALVQSKWSEDGKIWAYGLTEKGSDWMTLKFKTASGEDLPDTVEGVKYSLIAWLSDNSGVFYSRYPEHKGATEGTSTEKHQYHSIYFHKLGTPQSEDFLVADFRHNPNLMVSATVSQDGRYLFVTTIKGPVNCLYYYDLKSLNNKITGKLEMKPLFDKGDAIYYVMDTDGDTAVVLTNHDAPFFKVIRVNICPEGNDPSKWEVIIPEDSKRMLQAALPVDGNKLLTAYLEDCCNKVYINDIKTGKVLHQVPLNIGSLSGFSCSKKRSEVFFSFESFLTPTIIYRFDFKDTKDNDKLKIEEIRRVNIKDFDPTQFKIQQVFATSKDGTKIPMFIIHRADVKNDGQNVTLLDGYGGFNIPWMPYFEISRLLFLNNMDGIIASANLRGGSEYGKQWHADGSMHNKQNCFDDFAACAEYLIDHKFTSPKKLAIIGGSNGGLLVGAVSQQRPEIIGAAINSVGVLDMLRFHHFTVGYAWLHEYGNPDENKEDFECIYKYSPLHNIRIKEPGIEWPATLLISADHDDRVVSSHSLKYIAQLYYVIRNEAAHLQKKPIICRIEVKAGHGQGKPTSKIVAELTDIYSFISQVLDAKYHD